MGVLIIHQLLIVRIGITYNLRSDLPRNRAARRPEDAAEEFDLPETIDALRKVLAGEGHEVILLGGDLEVVEKIREFRIGFVFNIAEGFRGRNREAHIPAVLELMNLPYSGSDPLGLAVTLDKSLAKRVALSLGIPTPAFWVLHEEETAREIPDRFPLFVKPLWQGSSKGIRRTSRVDDRRALEREVRRLFEDYPEDSILVEEYIPGREFTVGMAGNHPPEVLGVMEIAFRDPAQKDFCYSLEVKRNWKEEVVYRFPAALERPVEKGIREAALRLFEVFRLRDVARFDFRVNPQGEFYFLEVNPLPGLAPESSDLVILAQKKGWSYRELVLKITQAAFGRYPELSESQPKILR